MYFLLALKAVRQKIEDFLTFFENKFGCRVHVLLKDVRGKHRNVDLFCKKSGGAMQRIEARNQASNGKAERMHRIIINMARCMIFASKLPFHFRVDAVEYAAYSFKCAPTNANE